MRVSAPAAWALAALISYLAGSSPTSARTPTPASGPMSERIEKEREGLEKLKRDIEVQRRKAREVVKKAGSILNEMEEIDGRLVLKERERRLAELRMEQKDAETAKIERETRALESSMGRQRGIVGARLRAIYKQRRWGAIGWLLTLKDPHDLLRRYAYVRRIARADQELFSGYLTTFRSLESRRADLARARASLQAIKVEAERTIGDIREDRRAKERLLNRIQAEKKTREKALAELEESGRQIQDLIRTLEEKRKAEGARPPPPGGTAGFVRGGLAWPSDGKVVAAFGRQRHPKFDFPIFRKGIEIAAPVGGFVRAAFEGTVSYADWFRGYGLLVIIDHGENYYSLYGHNAKLFVSVGDRVANGQVIGEVGETGLSEGRTVYFEIRHGVEALDPLQWLRRR